MQGSSLGPFYKVTNPTGFHPHDLFTSKGPPSRYHHNGDEVQHMNLRNTRRSGCSVSTACLQGLRPEGGTSHHTAATRGPPARGPHPAESPSPYPGFLRRAPAISHFPASPTPFSKVIEILTPLNMIQFAFPNDAPSRRTSLLLHLKDISGCFSPVKLTGKPLETLKRNGCLQLGETRFMQREARSPLQQEDKWGTKLPLLRLLFRRGGHF